MFQLYLFSSFYSRVIIDSVLFFLLLCLYSVCIFMYFSQTGSNCLIVCFLYLVHVFDISTFFASYKVRIELFRENVSLLFI